MIFFQMAVFSFFQFTYTNGGAIIELVIGWSANTIQQEKLAGLSARSRVGEDELGCFEEARDSFSQFPAEFEKMVTVKFGENKQS